MLPKKLLESAAYASLDLAARAMLTELVMLYKGDNNGALWLSVKDAAARLGQSDKRGAMRALDDLRDRGFITIAKEAHFATKTSDTSRARCWRLTWHSWLECPISAKRVPTNEWERYQPTGKTPASKRANTRLRALAAYRVRLANGYFTGVETTPLTPLCP